MRFLHLADLHLDAPFTGRSPAVRRALQDAAREALSRAVKLAVDEGLHAVVVAGDLFDGTRLSFATERFLTGAFGELAEAGIPLIYATGNHDPGEGRHPARGLDWPSNVTVVDGPEPVRVVIRDGKGRAVGAVTAAGHATARVSDDLAAGFPRPPREVPEVALLHAQVRGSRGEEGHHRYAPTDLPTLLGAGYDYWALGHVHVRQVLSRSPAVAYPGSLQGRNAREIGARGGFVVDLSEPEAPSLTFHPLAPVRWEILPISGLEEAGTLDRILEKVEGAWREAREADPGEPDLRWMVQLRLSGGCPRWRSLRSDEERRTLEDEVARLVGALDVEARTDRLGPPVDPARQRERTDVLGESLRLLERFHQGEPVLTVDPADLAGYDPERDGSVGAYARKLLRECDRELVARLRLPEGEGLP